MIQYNLSPITAMSLGSGLIVLSLVADFVFNARVNFFGYWQIATLLLGSILITTASQRQPNPWFIRMRQIAAACWVGMSGLGFTFYPDQWNLYYVVSFATIGGLVWFAPRSIHRFFSKIPTIRTLLQRPIRILKNNSGVQNSMLVLVSTLVSAVLIMLILEVFLHTNASRETLGVYGRQYGEWAPTLNSHGFRDTEHNREKPAGVVRIIVLGDSFTWGQGVKDREVYTVLLQDYAGPQVEFISLAMRGWSTADQLEALRDMGLSYDPDMVIIAAVNNDPEPHQSLPDGLPPRWRFFTYSPLRPRVFHFLDEKINQVMIPLGLRSSYSDWEQSLYDPEGPYWPAWEKTVTELAELVENHRLPTQAFVLSSVWPMNMPPDQVRQHQALADGFTAGNIPAINLWPLYVERFKDRDTDQLRVAPNDGHPGPELHAFYAEVIWKHIQSEVSRLLNQQATD